MSGQINPIQRKESGQKNTDYDILHDCLADIDIILSLCAYALASPDIDPRELHRGIDMARAKVEKLKRHCANQVTEHIKMSN